MEQKNRALRIVLHGAQCSGKTTLARALAAHFQTLWVPEFARFYLEVKKELDAGDVWPILWGQCAWQNALLPQARHFLFCDTDVFSSQVYAAFYYGLQTSQIERFCRDNRADFYLFCRNDLTFEPEADQRDSRDVQSELSARMRAVLTRENLGFAEVEGKGEKRLICALQALETANLIAPHSD